MCILEPKEKVKGKKEVEDKFEKCNNVERIDVKQFIHECHKIGKIEKDSVMFCILSVKYKLLKSNNTLIIN